MESSALSAINAYAWRDTNHNAPTHAPLWTIQLSHCNHAPRVQEVSPVIRERAGKKGVAL
jgi:hypothetical protein